MSGGASGADGALLAISDLHVSHVENRQVVERLRPRSQRDWLIVCGDVGDAMADVEWALTSLSERFAKVIWVPGNHELLTYPDGAGERDELRGEHRYDRLVEICRSIGVVTPEDPYPRWEGPGGPATVAPLFLLYDYSFAAAGAKDEALRRAYDAGVVCVDEFLLHPDPHPSREAWCRARVERAARRLDALPRDTPTVLVNHFPLVREPTRLLRHPEFAQWCGTERTADWHLRYRAAAVVYGHLHIPRTTWHDGVRFEEVSLGYPRERSRHDSRRTTPRQILPRPEAS